MQETDTNGRELTGSTGPENVAPCCRILLADEDLEMRKILGEFLRETSFEVTECSDGDCLLKRLGFYGLQEAAAFDLILSDTRMPGVSAPGGKLIAKRSSGKDSGRENFYLATQMAFNAPYLHMTKHHSKLNSHKSRPTYTDKEVER